ncbi:hypothetical protein BD410DRAFT_511349 [Rickenella mellea]|uniref:G domain-containing protein n=1 Tax=Rickenella mellea TaxID=50990 RepID=A0A4Y7PTV9_9AGAM|nr:hypothetical protein BD410DRAFT_511349 [Rickenella mellea]
MGATGSGISSPKFINDATGLNLEVRGDLDSCTSRVHATQILLDGRPVVLLDTPGFGHSSLSDAEVLRLTAEYLASLYCKELKLSGLLFMQRISDPRSDRQTRRNFRIFTKLCGHANLDRAVVVTTRWNEVDLKGGSGRENELKAGVFKPFLHAGGKIVRHDQTVGSAKEILRRVITQDVRVLAIQSQIVDDGKDLFATDAGLEVSRDVVVTRPRGFGSWLRKLWGG